MEDNGHQIYFVSCDRGLSVRVESVNLSGDARFKHKEIVSVVVSTGHLTQCNRLPLPPCYIPASHFG